MEKRFFAVNGMRGGWAIAYYDPVSPQIVNV